MSLAFGPTALDFQRLEAWLYPQLNRRAAAGAELPTVAEAAEALAWPLERVLERADAHPWISPVGDRADPAALRLDADGE